MKIIYLYVPHLPLQVERRRRKNKDSPYGTIIGGRPWDPSVVLDCSAEAEAAGVVPGMSLARAALRCPEAQCLPADHSAYQDAQAQLEATLRGFTDRVETAGLGAFFLEVGQLTRRFPDDETLTSAVIETARGIDAFYLQVGLAERRFTAEQAALAARPNQAIIVLRHQGRGFLSSLPLAALPAETEFIRRLGLLGVHTLGGLAALPRTALIRQFGAQAAFLHDLAANADPRPVQPDAPPLELRHLHTFEPPTAIRSFLLTVAEQMATVLGQTLSRQGYQAQGLRVEITDTAEVPHTTTTSIEPPTAEAEQLSRRIQFLVNRLHLDRPAETIEVVVYPLRPSYLGATQLAIFSATRDHRARQLQEALRRVRARFGEFIVMIASLIRPPGPRPIEVVTDAAHAPQTLICESNALGQGCAQYRVRRIYEHWRERRHWWAHPILRDYYRLEDTTGAVRLIYQDLATHGWWLERRV